MALLRGEIRRASNEAVGAAITRLTRIAMYYVAAEETSSIAAAGAILRNCLIEPWEDQVPETYQ